MEPFQSSSSSGGKKLNKLKNQNQPDFLPLFGDSEEAARAGSVNDCVAST